MDYRNLISETWNGLDNSGDLIKGYKSCWLTLDDERESNLHIFKDKAGQYHFAIEEEGINKTDLDVPYVNGLKVQLVSYRFESGKVSQFIDLICNISGFLEEFTEVVREVSKLILEYKEPPIKAVKETILKWISFWSNLKKEILSEDGQIGLICELIILDRLCKINTLNALNSWVGPLGEKHDFNFSGWNLEVKGTRNSKRTHIINGIDQLKPPSEKQLAFVSFQLLSSHEKPSLNLPDLIDSISRTYFGAKPYLIVKFNELLALAGYSPLHTEEYKKFNVQIIDSLLFEVNNVFPKLTSDMLIDKLNSRISSVEYQISLEGLFGFDINTINFSDYFY